MVTQEEIFKFEIEKFKKSQEMTKEKETLEECLRKAIKDAFVNSCVSHKNHDQELIETIAVEYRDEKEMVKQEFFESIDNSFEYLCGVFKKWANKHNLKKEEDSEEGRAFKFAAMTFKYLYCCDKIRNIYKEKFLSCYLPLDTYILNGWYKSYLKNEEDDKEIVEEIRKDLEHVRYKDGSDNYAWTKMNGKLYSKIQNHVQRIIDKGYCYECSFYNEKICCKIQNRLELDFIVWPKEKEKYGQDDKACLHIMDLSTIWDRYSENKCAFCEWEKFYKDEFVKLVKETFKVINKFKFKLLGKDFNERDARKSIADKKISARYVLEYNSLLIAISKYAVEDSRPDESGDYLFKASQIIARRLLDYAVKHYSSEKEDKGVLTVKFENIKLNNPEEEEILENEMHQFEAEYDISEGNMKAIIEVIKEIENFK